MVKLVHLLLVTAVVWVVGCETATQRKTREEADREALRNPEHPQLEDELGTE